MKQRIVTGVIGGAAFITLLYVGGLWFASLISLFAIIGLYELVKMAKIKWWSIPSLIGIITTAGIVFSAYDRTAAKPLEALALHIDFSEIIIGLLLFLFIWVVLSKNEFTIEQAGIILLGVIYIGIGFFSFIHLREAQGFHFVLFVLLLIWATDAGAYFVGKYTGKNKLWPAISPNKTIEGSVGGTLIAIGGALLLELWSPIFHSYTQAVIIAVVISIAGQFGDLVESAIKRYYDVKDSGHLLPGHGGILDRTDSWLFVFSILYVLQLV